MRLNPLQMEVGCGVARLPIRRIMHRQMMRWAMLPCPAWLRGPASVGIATEAASIKYCEGSQASAVIVGFS